MLISPILQLARCERLSMCSLSLPFLLPTLALPIPPSLPRSLFHPSFPPFLLLRRLTEDTKAVSEQAATLSRQAREKVSPPWLQMRR